MGYNAMSHQGMEQDAARPGARFATTRWSVVLRAGAGDGGDGASAADTRQALGDLIRAYWYPLYAFARRKGSGDHDAMDLTQGFFAHLLAGDALASVSPAKGRFRSFLLASFQNYMANQRRATGAVRRGGAVTTVSLGGDDFRARYDREPVDRETPEVLYQRSWVEALLTRVRSRLADEYGRAGKAELFALLEPHLTPRADAPPRAEVGRKLNLSPAAVAMSIHRMRRAYGDLLRQEVAATVDDPADVEDELCALMESVARSG